MVVESGKWKWWKFRIKNLEFAFGRVSEIKNEKLKIKNHSPLEGESNEQGFSEVRLVGGKKDLN